MHCTDAPCAAVCPVNCFYITTDAVVLHSKDLCIGCGYCFYACPFGAPQYPKVGNFGSRGKRTSAPIAPAARKQTVARPSTRKYGANRPAEGKLPLCAEMCSTKSLLAGDGDVIAQITRIATVWLRCLGLADSLRRDNCDLIGRSRAAGQKEGFGRSVLHTYQCPLL